MRELSELARVLTDRFDAEAEAVAVLGQRLAGRARDSEAVATELQARGVNPLITGAFRTRGNAA